MADLISAGDDEPPGRPPWLLPSAAVAVVAVVLGVVALQQHPSQPTGEPPGRPSATAPVSPSPVVVGAQPWPTAPGACGAEARLPLLSTEPLRERTGLTVLVGGAGLRRVSVDSGRVSRLADGEVTWLASSAVGRHAIRNRCSPRMTFQHGAVLAVGRNRATELSRAPADGLVSAPDTTWAFTFPTDPTRRPMVLRPVDGRPAVRLPLGFEASAATSSAFLGSLPIGDEPGAGFELAAVSRARLTDVHRLGRGFVAAATDAVTVISRSDCDETTSCVLTRLDAGGDLRDYRLPRGRTPTSGFVLSPDRSRLAFQLARVEPDPRYDSEHPGGPSDLVVLDLRTGQLDVVPGIELAPKASVGLAFGPDSRWLVVSVNEGRRTRLLVWRPGLPQPLVSPARLPGLVLYDAPVLTLP